MTYAVDIPNFNSEEWDLVTVFETREDAIAFADEEGRITLVSLIPDDAEVPA